MCSFRAGTGVLCSSLGLAQCLKLVALICNGAKFKIRGMVYMTLRIHSGPKVLLVKSYLLDFPGGTVVKNPPANAGDTGSIPGPGRSHMPRSN